MFLYEMSGVLPGDLLAFVAADRFAKVREDLGRGLVVRRAPLFHELGCLAKPYLRLFDHLLHPLLPLALLLGCFALCRRLMFLLLFRVILDAQLLGTTEQHLQRAA